MAHSIYLDDRPGAPLRFMVEPNLTMIIRRMMKDIDAADLRTELGERIRGLFSLPRGEFLAPAGPYEVFDEIGDGRPLLVIIPGMKSASSRPSPTLRTALNYFLEREIRGEEPGSRHYGRPKVT